MSASVTERDARRCLKTGVVYLLLALLCALLGAVYESFSHEVYSPYMLYAFFVPLAGGALPFCALALGNGRAPGRAAGGLYHAGLATLTVGSFVRGALEIYGTANALTRLYWFAGAALTALGVLRHLLAARRAVPPGRTQKNF